jgi:2-amino-4-hydroxy-6-hydroxymethyldihydropteridine diphosphokinase
MEAQPKNSRAAAAPATGHARLHAPIIIALGANLPSRFGAPAQTLDAALRALRRAGLRVYRQSAWHRSAAEPRGAGPAFANGVILVETTLRPSALLALLHGIERRFGRRRRRRNEPRVLDLDLIDYRGQVAEGLPALPHPRAHQRAFVLRPIAQLAPSWRHPIFKARARDLLKAEAHCAAGSDQVA